MKHKELFWLFLSIALALTCFSFHIFIFNNSLELTSFKINDIFPLIILYILSIAIYIFSKLSYKKFNLKNNEKLNELNNSDEEKPSLPVILYFLKYIAILYFITQLIIILFTKDSLGQILLIQRVSTFFPIILLLSSSIIMIKIYRIKAKLN